MNGCLIKNTQIAVDLWTHEQLRDANFFFLTHLHEDHIKGLTSSWRFPIYTSPINKILLDERFLFSHDLVIPMELNEPHIISLNTKYPSSMSVTLIDANHVPGAVMFLFQGYFGTILYCGDMRYEPNMLKHFSIEESLRSGGIDHLYLDNTFCCPSYDFPSREYASQQVFNIIEDHPNHCIKLGVRKLGKENLLERIAIKFKERILVSEEKYKQLKLMGRLDVYTTNPNDSRIEALIIQRIHARNHLKWNQIKPTVSIKLTAIYYGVKNDFCANNISNMITVPYSDHSSWSELHEFVAGLKPRCITPIVKRNVKKKDFISKALSSTFDMSIFDSYLSPQFTTTSLSFPEFISNKFHEVLPKLGSGCRQSQKKLLRKKRKFSAKGVVYESFDDSSDDGQLKSTRNELLLTSFDSNDSQKLNGVHLLENEIRGNEAHQNQHLSTNSFCVINDSSVINNSFGNERKYVANKSINLSETYNVSNEGNNLNREIGEGCETTQEFVTLVDECSKDLSQICELYKSCSENFEGFETIENNSSLIAIRNKLLGFVEDRINFEKSQSFVMEKSSDVIQVNEMNTSQVDKFNGFDDNETNSTKEIKKKLCDFIEDCLHSSKVLSQTSEERLGDLPETSEANVSLGDKFEGFDSSEQPFNIIRRKLLCFVKTCVSASARRSPNMEKRLKEESHLIGATISDEDVFNCIEKNSYKKKVSGNKKLGNHNVQKLSSNLELNKRFSNERNDESYVNSVPRKHSFLPIANTEQPTRTNMFCEFEGVHTLSEPHNKLLISAANNFTPILCSTSISEDSLLSSISVSDDALSVSTFVSGYTISSSASVDDDILSSTSVGEESVNKPHQSQIFEENSDARATDEFFRRDMFQTANSQLESALMELKEGEIPFKKLNDLCNTIKQYINAF